MNKIGNKKIIFSETFIFSINETVSILSKLIDGTELPIEIKVHESSQPDNSAAEWVSKDGKLFLDFYGFKNIPHPRMMQSPARIGDSHGESLSFLTSISRHVNAVTLHLQIMLGGDL